MVLYPNDASENGKELRLRQQYFLACASIKDVIREWRCTARTSALCRRNCFQLNDTHPTVAVPELMRQLMDEHGTGVGTGLGITTRTMAYTNHTLLPEALETWPCAVRQLLPRMLEIIYEINARFLSEVADALARRYGSRSGACRSSRRAATAQVRMAYLAIVGSFSVNGVAALHTELLKQACSAIFTSSGRRSSTTRPTA
jgi:starch phosphorylase